MDKELMEQIAIKIYIVAMKSISGVLADTAGGYPEWHQASKQNKSFYLEQAKSIIPIIESQVQAERERVFKMMYKFHREDIDRNYQYHGYDGTADD